MQSSSQLHLTDRHYRQTDIQTDLTDTIADIADLEDMIAAEACNQGLLVRHADIVCNGYALNGT